MNNNVSYTVICAFNRDHKLEVDLEVKDGNASEESSIDVYCPFCDKYVTAKIDKKVADDTVIFRQTEWNSDKE